MPQKKSYSVHWEDEKAVSFEVDGVIYNSLNDIPDKKDKRKLQAMMSDASEPDFDEKEWEEAKQESQKAESTILMVFSGVAALMLLITLVSAVLNIRKVASERSAPGTVVELTKITEFDENDSDRVIGEAYYPVVRFTADDGRRRNVQLSEGSFPPAYETGDEVTVRYDPAHPLDARIDSFGSSMLMWILPTITGILGLAFGGGVWVVKTLMK